MCAKVQVHSSLNLEAVVFKAGIHGYSFIPQDGVAWWHLSDPLRTPSKTCRRYVWRHTYWEIIIGRTKRENICHTLLTIISYHCFDSLSYFIDDGVVYVEDFKLTGALIPSTFLRCNNLVHVNEKYEEKGRFDISPLFWQHLFTLLIG